MEESETEEEETLETRRGRCIFVRQRSDARRVSEGVKSVVQQNEWQGSKRNEVHTHTLLSIATMRREVKRATTARYTLRLQHRIIPWSGRMREFE